jgi:hypothetical protein
VNSSLARKLIEKGAIRQGTVFEANYNAFGLSCVNSTETMGEFILMAAKALKDGTLIFEAIDEKDFLCRVNSIDVTRMDGMDIERVAEIYGLAETGSDVKVAKRRGRKPKNVMDGSL